MSRLHIQKEMVMAMAATESLIYVAGLIWGKKTDSAKHIDTVDDALAFARMING